MAHMIEKYDSMVSRDLVPWHGLGVVWDGPMDTETVMRESGLTWKVLERQGMVFPIETDNWSACPMDGHKVLLRGDIDPPLVLGVVSEKYAVLQNHEIFEALQPLVEDGLLEWETAGSLRNGKTVWALARFREQFETEITPGDRVRRYALLTTSHDGTSTVVLQPTGVRVVCNNTLQASLSYGSQLKFSHVGAVGNRVATAADALVRIGESFDEVAQYYRHMADTGLTAKQQDAYFRLILPDAPKKAKQMQNNINAKRQLWKNWSIDTPENRDLSSYRPDSLWAAFGAVTRFSTHAVSNRVQDRTAHAIDGGGAQLGRRAFDTAVEVLKDPDILEEAAELAGVAG